jgi:hypothetical protein
LYDIEFNNSNLLQFDIKGTVIPVEFRDNLPALIQNPEEMIRFFYEKQSGGVRKNIQNRLFIVHHSFISQEREMYIRCQWDFKSHLFKEYAQNISTTANFINYKSVKADVVFIFENVDKTISANIFSIQ